MYGVLDLEGPYIRHRHGVHRAYRGHVIVRYGQNEISGTSA
ncbi:hypothetical protein HMPREF0663_10111 [Hoylesella oralis ATCC 33269]|uniref:Uncharacterized protein n=1 Tax=Hoylesella oralis ATCC 33269 TaxID=873533 RepID=E7RLW1_9BACT|nr:hypothetical protein HMPREF0663_10111 [Hoylesella oralis ATCC 33269]